MIKIATWWRHQMETFSTLLAICAGNSPVHGEFPTQRPVMQSFVFFDLRLNKRLSKQSWGWWFEILSHPLWCHCNVLLFHIIRQQSMLRNIALTSQNTQLPILEDFNSLIGPTSWPKRCCQINLVESFYKFFIKRYVYDKELIIMTGNRRKDVFVSEKKQILWKCVHADHVYPSKYRCIWKFFSNKTIYVKM